MLYIRTDMNDIMATGHMMRCLSIADAAKRIGEDSTFLLSDYQAVELIEERGYHFIVLNTKWDCLEKELDILQELIQKYRIKKILVDSYQVTYQYLESLSRYVKIIYIDDLNLFVYPVDTLICYMNYWKKFNYETIYRQTKLLLGTKYTPVRECYKNCGKKNIRPKIEKLLLMSGGTDHFNLLEKILEKIQKEKYIRIDVICGRYYNHYELLRQRYKQCHNVFFYKAVKNIEHYMFQADMAISAGGTTLYELCACGTPTISYSFADNQKNNVFQFQDDGIIDYAGDIRESDVVEMIVSYLEKYYGRPDLRAERSEKMQGCVDGKGSERIARMLSGEE